MPHEPIAMEYDDSRVNWAERPDVWINPSQEGDSVEAPLEFEDFKRDIDIRGGYMMEVQTPRPPFRRIWSWNRRSQIV